MSAIGTNRPRYVWRKCLPYFAILSILLCPSVLQAQSDVQTLQLGGRHGWPELVLGSEAALVPGWQGGDDIALSDAYTDRLHHVDLLLDGESHRIHEAEGTYRAVTEGAVRVESQSARGRGAVFVDGPATVRLEPLNVGGASPGGLFAGRQSAQSFTVEFWTYPLSLEEGGAVMEWRGTYVLPDRPVHQEFRVDLHRGRFRWLLKGFWPIDDSMVDAVELKGRSPVVPRQWHHHQLYYDGRTGKLEYRVDGIPEDIVYATANGTERASTGPVSLGAASRNGLVIGRGYRGGLDDLTVYRGTPEQMGTSDSFTVSYAAHSATVLTHPISLGNRGTVVESIGMRTERPAGTEVRAEYRIGEMLVSREPQSAIDSAWVQIDPNGESALSSGAQGRYLQLRFRLLADPFKRETPRVQEVHVAYRDVPPPPPPFDLTARTIDNGVELQWPAVLLPSVAGYRVHVYEETGPAGARYGRLYDVGSNTKLELTTLDPDRAYVFAVEVYDRYGQTSVQSVERQARAGGTSYETPR